MLTVFLDFESYFDKQTFSLAQISSEAYVRDQRWETLLLSIAIDDSKTAVCEGDEIPYVLSQIPMERPDVRVVAHNFKFDGMVQTQRYNKFIANPICTRAMARWTGISRLVGDSLHNLGMFFGLPEKQEGTLVSNGKRKKDFTPDEWAYFKWYAGYDTDLLRAIYNLMLPFMTDDAMQFISMTEQMYIHPMLRIDWDKICDYEQRALIKYNDNRERIKHIFNFKDEAAFLTAIRSPKQFPEMLKALDCQVPMKFSLKKTKTARKKAKAQLEQICKFLFDHGSAIDGSQAILMQERIENLKFEMADSKYTPATSSKDIDFLILREHPNEDVATLVDVKLNVNSSLQLSRARTLKDIATRGTLPVPLEAYKAVTGRYGVGSGEGKGDGLNTQNFDSHKGDKTIKEAIIAPPGYTLIGADSSQIEARLLAVLACQSDLVQGFANNEDVYCELAGAISGRDPQEIRYYAKGQGAKEDPIKHKEADTLRFYGKTGVLSAGYGVGAQKYADYYLSRGIWLAEKGDREGHLEESKRHLRIYRRRNGWIVNFWGRCEDVIVNMIDRNAGWFAGPDDNIFYYDGNHQAFGHRLPGIMLPDGYWIVYPNLRRFTETDRKSMDMEEDERESYLYDKVTMSRGRKRVVTPKFIHGSMITNNVTQGIASSILRWQVLRYREESGYPVVMNVHDFWMSMVLDAVARQALDRLMYWLRQTPPWFKAFVPLDCEGGMGKNYGQI